MNLLKKLLGFTTDPREALVPLYISVVEEARRPAWYAEFGVEDTIDGRFDMIAAVMALVIARLDAEGEAGREPQARLTEVFIDDMDGQLRQLGIGDVVVGKHIGKMISALGGRLSAYTSTLRDPAAFEEALVRNLWRSELGPDAKPAEVAERLRTLAAKIDATDWATLKSQGLPA